MPYMIVGAKNPIINPMEPIINQPLRWARAKGSRTPNIAPVIPQITEIIPHKMREFFGLAGFEGTVTILEPHCGH
jgi:hypothetical protein